MYSGVIKIKILRDILPRDSVVTIYKSFIRPHLDSCDVVSDQTNNDSFFDKIEQLQYKACLAITGDIQRTSREYFYNELRLESLTLRRRYRRLCVIYKLLLTQCPKYLFDILPFSESFYDTRKKQRPFSNCRTDCFKYSFFPNSLSEWSQLGPEIQNSQSIVVFKGKLLSFIRPSKRSIFNVNDPEGVKYLTRLHLRFSHLNEHKFRHGLVGTLSSLSNCSLEVEDNEYFFLLCLKCENARRPLFNDIFYRLFSLFYLRKQSNMRLYCIFLSLFWLFLCKNSFYLFFVLSNYNQLYYRKKCCNKTVAMLIFNSTSFNILIIVSVFTFNSLNSYRKI